MGKNLIFVNINRYGSSNQMAKTAVLKTDLLVYTLKPERKSVLHFRFMISKQADSDGRAV
jgi:hypothetical protein